MQVCYLTTFNNLPFNPSTYPTHFRKKESMVCSSSFQLLCAHKGMLGTPFKEPIVKTTKRNGVRYSILCCRRKCASSSLHNLEPKETFGRQSCDYRWQSRDSMSRDIIVRSEIAGTGSPGAAYQISDLQLVSKVRGAGFYAVTSAVALVLFVFMVVGHPLVLLMDRHCRKFHHLIAKIWATLTVTPFFKIKYEGLENLPPIDSPAVYVSNHQSFLDIYTLLTLGRSFKFISKTAIFLFPVVGWAMFLLGCIPLKRMDSRSQLQTLKRCIELVKNGGSVFFFPEGTRSMDGKLGTFKKGAFSIAAKVGVPVVPITLIGTGKIMPRGLETILNSGSVKVVIHPSIEGKDPNALCNEARNIIAQELSHLG